MIYDAAILGAGCAGLHLAVALRRRCPELKLLLLDARKTYTDDRTWSLWLAKPNAGEDLAWWTQAIEHQWLKWRVSESGHSVVGHAPGLRYVTLRGSAFYETAKEQLKTSQNLHWQLGTTVTSVEERHGKVEVRTDKGTFQALHSFDSRNLPGQVGDTEQAESFVQVFHGLRLRVRLPWWDSETVDLMEFMESELGRIRFVYTLPTAADTALVEVTWMVPTGDATRPGRADVQNWLREKHGLGPQDYEILEEENGLIPMDPSLGRAAPRGPRQFTIGTAAGAVRASTGYGFLAMARQADAIAQSWKEMGFPTVPRPRSRGWAILDAVFLSAMRTRPDAAPGWFFRLFSQVPALSLVRFLQDEASPVEVMRLLKVLPKWPFLQAALSQRHFLLAELSEYLRR